MQKAFSGPLVLQERLGSIDAGDARVRRPRAGLPRQAGRSTAIPGSMAKRVHELAVHVRDRYDGDAARVWTDAADARELRANLEALPGFGEMKVKALGAVLAKRFGVEAAARPGAVAPDAGRRRLAAGARRLPGAKRAHKAEWSKAQARA